MTPAQSSPVAPQPEAPGKAPRLKARSILGRWELAAPFLKNTTAGKLNLWLAMLHFADRAKPLSSVHLMQIMGVTQPSAISYLRTLSRARLITVVGEVTSQGRGSNAILYAATPQLFTLLQLAPPSAAA